MREYKSNEILFSIHLPKTAGTSFTNVLREWFWPGFQAHYYRHEVDKMPFRPPFWRWCLHYSGVRPMCIHGHFEGVAGVYECYPKASQFITVLRDPLELQLSLFHFHKKKQESGEGLLQQGKKVEMGFGGDIDRWVEERDSFMLKYFPWEMTRDNYKEVINEHFIHIGVTENLQQSVDIMAEKLKKKSVAVPSLNTTTRTLQPSASAVQKFKEKHQLE